MFIVIGQDNKNQIYNTDHIQSIEKINISDYYVIRIYIRGCNSNIVYDDVNKRDSDYQKLISKLNAEII